MARHNACRENARRAAARQNALWRTHTTSEHLGVRASGSVDLLPDTVCESFYDQVPSAKLPSYLQTSTKVTRPIPYRTVPFCCDSFRLVRPASELRFDPDSPFLSFSDSFATHDRALESVNDRSAQRSPPNETRYFERQRFWLTISTNDLILGR